MVENQTRAVNVLLRNVVVYRATREHFGCHAERSEESARGYKRFFAEFTLSAANGLSMTARVFNEV